MSLTRRNFIKAGLFASAGFTFSSSFAAANETIGVGIIGCGGRGGELSGGFHNLDGAKVVACADPDSQRVAKLANKFGAKAYGDMRELLKDPAVDVVVIATCNHWHCLAAIWALEAGKDVYVEKPLSHSQWEGRQVVNAARKHKKIVQLGTQQRSDPMQAEAKAFLHEEQALGKILYVQANRLGARGPVGLRKSPLVPPAEVNYDLWLGPAQDEPIYRDNLHYDWHWNWNTGSGEMGNWGVHILDDVRNVVYRDKVQTPQRIMALAGRVAWNDAAESPNVHYAFFDTGDVPCLIALSNLKSSPDAKKGSWTSRNGIPLIGPGSGYVVVCENGYYLGSRGNGKAVDKQGKTLKTFKGGDINKLHKQNFLAAVRSRDNTTLNAEIAVGHDSTGWCNLANIAFQAGEAQPLAQQAAIAPDFTPWQTLVEELEQQLKPFDLQLSDLKLGPVLQHDPAAERFTGEHAESANQLLKREYRGDFVVPEYA